MTMKELDTFIRLGQGPYISAYTDEGAKQKDEFKRLGKKLAREIAKVLGLSAGSYDVRYNPGGVAVCGDIHLHGECIYIALEQTVIGSDFGFMYRHCKGRKDYTGGHNRWMKWPELYDLNAACDKFRTAIQEAR